MAGEYFAAALERLRTEDAARATQGSAEMAQLAPLGPVDSPGPEYVGLPASNITIAERFGRSAKVLFKPLELTFGGLQRGTSAFRETLLYAGGVTSFKGYKKRVMDAFKGDNTVTGREFAEYIVGEDTLSKLDQMETSIRLPGWLKAAIVPEHVAAGTKARRNVTVGDLFSLSVDLAVDPFAVLALTPVGAGRYVPGIVKKAVSMPFKPITKGLDLMFAPSRNSLLGFVNFARDPENVLTGPLRTILEEWRFAGGKTARALETSMERAEAIGGDVLSMKQYHRDTDQRIAAWLHDQELVRDGNAWSLTMKRGAKAASLSPEELKVAEGFRSLANEKIQGLVAWKPKRVSRYVYQVTSW